jgi:uncharacterized protein YhbP (UPF0306 family)
VFTLATEHNHKPWCATCFYAYIETEQILIFTSDDTTRHIKEITHNPYISGTIVLETKIIGKIQGVQFEGALIKLTEEQEKLYKRIYLTRFPYAILKPASLWGIELLYIKFTDNRLGFGKKLIWEK